MDNKELLEPALRDFVAYDGPAFLEVMIDQNADVFPMVGPGLSYGNMITGAFIPSRRSPEDKFAGKMQTLPDLF